MGKERERAREKHEDRNRATMETKTLVDGSLFPEGPRWYEGALYVSDMYDGIVHKISEQEGSWKKEELVRVPNQPSGTGW